MRTETVYYLPQRRRDRNGDFIGPVDVKVPIYGVVIWPRASEEKDGGEINVDGENLRLPDSTDARLIRSDGSLEVRGDHHVVDEPPARFAGKAIMVKTKRVST